MYDINLYDRNIKQYDILMFYEIVNDMAICCFQVTDVCVGSTSMDVQSIRTYDGFYRHEFWKYISDFQKLYRIKELF